MHKQLKWAGTVSNSKEGQGQGQTRKQRGEILPAQFNNKKSRWYNQRPPGQFIKTELTVSLVISINYSYAIHFSIYWNGQNLNN